MKKSRLFASVLVLFCTVSHGANYPIDIKSRGPQQTNVPKGVSIWSTCLKSPYTKIVDGITVPIVIQNHGSEKFVIKRGRIDATTNLGKRLSYSAPTVKVTHNNQFQCTEKDSVDLFPQDLVEMDAYFGWGKPFWQDSPIAGASSIQLEFSVLTGENGKVYQWRLDCDLLW